MSEPTDRFVIEIGSGTVGHIIDTDVTESRTDAGLSFSPSAPGKKMCTRGYHDYRFQRVPFSTFVEYHEIDKTGFEGDAPDEICSYCWSNTREELQTRQERAETKHADRVGTVGYCLRWKQKGRARDEWYESWSDPRRRWPNWTVLSVVLRRLMTFISACTGSKRSIWIRVSTCCPTTSVRN